MRIYLVFLHIVIVVLLAIILGATIGRRAGSLLRIEPVRLQVDHAIQTKDGFRRLTWVYVDNDRVIGIMTRDKELLDIVVSADQHPWSWRFQWDTMGSRIRSVQISNTDLQMRRLPTTQETGVVVMYDLNADGIPNIRRELNGSSSMNYILKSDWELSPP